MSSVSWAIILHLDIPEATEPLGAYTWVKHACQSRGTCPAFHGLLINALRAPGLATVPTLHWSA